MTFLFLKVHGQLPHKVIIDLSTGEYDGTTMEFGIVDPNWSLTRSDGKEFPAYTRNIYTDWYQPSLENGIYN